MTVQTQLGYEVGIFYCSTSKNIKKLKPVKRNNLVNSALCIFGLGTSEEAKRHQLALQQGRDF